MAEPAPAPPAPAPLEMGVPEEKVDAAASERMDDGGEMECLRQERDDKDAQLRLAAEIGQAVVEENEAMKHRLEEMQTVLEESEHRAACAEAEREEAEYSLEEVHDQREALDAQLARQEEGKEQDQLHEGIPPSRA